MWAELVLGRLSKYIDKISLTLNGDLVSPVIDIFFIVAVANVVCLHACGCSSYSVSSSSFFSYSWPLSPICTAIVHIYSVHPQYLDHSFSQAYSYLHESLFFLSLYLLSTYTLCFSNVFFQHGLAFLICCTSQRWQLMRLIYTSELDLPIYISSKIWKIIF